MSAPTILITGSTSGLGLAAAARIATTGARVVLHGRREDRVARAERAVRAQQPAARIATLVADLSRRSEIEALAREVGERFPTLDVLVHNAAVVPRTRAETPEGIEMQFAVNHLAPMLLTARLLPQLRRVTGSRVVLVASQVERDGVIDFNDLQSTRTYDPAAAYRQSKLANVLFTRALARRIPEHRPTVNCLHPGIAGTRVLNALLGRANWLRRWTQYREPSAESIAEPLVRLILDRALDDVSGAYFCEFGQRLPSERGRDDTTGELLWQESNRLLGLPSDWTT